MKVGFAFVLFTIILLLIASCFKKKQREILWGAGIVIFLAALSSVVFGLLEMTNHLHLVTVTIAVVVSGVYIVYAEKLHKKLLAKQEHVSITDEQKIQYVVDESKDSSCTSTAVNTEIEERHDEVILSSRLDSPIAQGVFQKAELVGLIKKDCGHYKWVSSKNRVLLAYLCGRIYCNDKCEYDRIEKKFIWKPGKGTFPGSDLSSLFNEPNLSQYRQNRKGLTAPEDFQIIDKLFD